jgi:hypothetical protein
MSTFIEVVAWVIIGYAALPLAITLLDLATGLQVKDMRHGRAKTMSEEWPDLRPFLPVLAVGVSLLALQWNPDTARWWLAQSPLFAIGALYLAAWLRSCVRRGPGMLADKSDLSSSLVVVAIGVSLLALQWNTDTAKWWLAHIPIFAVVVVYLASWIRSRVIRGPGKPSAESS